MKVDYFCAVTYNSIFCVDICPSPILSTVAIIGRWIEFFKNKNKKTKKRRRQQNSTSNKIKYLQLVYQVKHHFKGSLNGTENYCRKQ